MTSSNNTWVKRANAEKLKGSPPGTTPPT